MKRIEVFSFPLWIVRRLVRNLPFTGVLFLPWGYDLSMWGSVAIYFVNFYFGADVWKVPLTESGLMCGHFLEAVLYIGAMSNLPMVFYNLYRSYKDKTGKMRDLKECMRPMAPLVFFLVISILWAHYSPNNIVKNHPRAVYLLTGTVFSNISCRLIVNQMSNTKSETFHWMTPILALGFIVSVFIPRLERFLLYLLLVASSLAHWHYGTVVVQQMCKHFNRICFGVGKRNDKVRQD